MGYKGLGNSRELFDRKNAVVLLVCNDVANQLLTYDLLVVGESVNQGCITQDIDHPWNPAAGGSDQYLPSLHLALSSTAGLWFA